MFNVPASLMKVRPVLLIDSGRSALMVPRLVTCALTILIPVVAPELRSVPLLISVPVVTNRLEPATPEQQLCAAFTRSMVPSLVELFARVSVYT